MADDKKTTTTSDVVVEPKEKPAKKAASSTRATKHKKTGVTVDLHDVTGKVVETISLPEELFGQIVNKTLLAQAVRIYLANKRQGTACTKTRGEVDGSTRKIYRQKGTGRARHGSVRAPIFVKGGIVFGPKPRDYGLSFPKKMKRKALCSALSSRVLAKEVLVVSGISKLEPKTKIFADMLQKLSISGKKKSILFIVPTEANQAKQGIRNIPGVQLINAMQLNAYDVLKKKQVLIMQESLAEMEKTFLTKEESK